MSVESLKCKECGSDVRARRAAISANGASGRSRWPTTTRRWTRPRRSGGSRPARRGSGATPTSCPFAGRPGDPLELGADAAAARRPAGRAARASPSSASRTTRSTRRTRSRIASWPSPSPRPRAGLQTRGLRLDRQPGQRVAAHAAAAGLRGLRLRPRRPRGAEGARDRRSTAPTWSASAATTTTSTGSARRSPSGRLGVRQRQPAAVLRRGLQVDGLRDRRAAGLGAARPRRRPMAGGSLISKIDKRLQGVSTLGLVEGGRDDLQRRPGHGLQPDRRPPSPKAGTSQAAEPGDDRQEPGDRRPGRRVLRLEHDRRDRRLRARTSTTRRSSTP